jgi:hypothetical protein
VFKALGLSDCNADDLLKLQRPELANYILSRFHSTDLQEKILMCEESPLNEYKLNADYASEMPMQGYNMHPGIHPDTFFSS